MEEQTSAKTITIYDIAQEAGVSAATVSRVLTKSANVSKEKRERIEAIIAKYNFTPNALAKGLSDTKRRVIGVIAADVRNPYYADTFVAIEVAARELGYSVLLLNSLGETSLEITQLEVLRSQRVDAVIQLGGRADDDNTDEEYAKNVKQVVDAGIPVIVTGKADGSGAYRVSIDAKKGMILLMDHLLSLGHRKIALIGGRLDVVSTRVKYETYCEILNDHNIAVNDDYVVFNSYDYGAGYNGMSQILELEDQPTAIIAINDFAAAGVMRLIMDKGLSVPDDYSIVSYDNTNIAGLMIPKLTSIDYNYQEYGRTLVKVALDALDHKQIDELTLVSPTLDIKESSRQL